MDWYAWNPDTLRLAREQDKPILLSIGYSACHWCHVMAHESFEDAEVAAVMNEHFINIKVDREERPDLDQIYQTAHHMLTQRSGGWPLTMFLSPDGTPFFGGTYFPKQARYNLPAFPDLLQRVAQVYAENRAELAEQGEQLVAALAATCPRPAGAYALNDAPLALAVQQNIGTTSTACTAASAARRNSCIRPNSICCCAAAMRPATQQARHIVHFTLQQMAHGGLYDQLGGGFCRYSVDERWDIPHFEKMLYDNGLLLGLYCDAWQSSGDPLFARVVEQTAAWVMREMQSPEGGYYSSLDADSEHEEGKFYVWQRDEIRGLLSAEEYARGRAPITAWTAHPISNTMHGICASARRWNEIAQALGAIPQNERGALLASAQKKLFAAREQRIRPGRDEKILGSWNGLMIAGMARAARVFDRPDWLHSAQQAMDFVRTTLWRDGKLLATYKDGKAHLNAYLDDHAFLLNALLELLQAEYRSADLAFARATRRCAAGTLRRQAGRRILLHQPRPRSADPAQQDRARTMPRPSGNGIAAQALLRLSLLTGKTEYAEAAERCLKLFFPALQQAAGLSQQPVHRARGISAACLPCWCCAEQPVRQPPGETRCGHATCPM